MDHAFYFALNMIEVSMRSLVFENKFGEKKSNGIYQFAVTKGKIKKKKI